MNQYASFKDLAETLATFIAKHIKDQQGFALKMLVTIVFRLITIY